MTIMPCAAANGYRIVCTEEVFTPSFGAAQASQPLGFRPIGRFLPLTCAALKKMAGAWPAIALPGGVTGHQLRSMVDDKIQLYRTVLDRAKRIMELEHENARLRTMSTIFQQPGLELLTSLRRIRAQYFH